MSRLSLKQLASFAADQLVAGKSGKKLSGQLAAYLIERRQTKDTASLMRLIESEMARRGVTEVTVVSAHSVEPNVKKHLAKALGASNPVFHEQIDSSVVGGVRASTLERELDLTITTKLRSLVSNLKGKA